MKKSSVVVSLIVAVLVGALAGYGLSFTMGAARTSTSTSTTSIFVTTTTINQNEIVTLTSATRTIFSVSTETETLPTTATETLFVLTSNVLSPSLQLSASVRPSNITVGENITVNTEVYNPLPLTVTLNGSSIHNPSEAPCGVGVIAVRIYAGHFLFSNISNATPLLLYNDSFAPLCPVLIQGTYSFLPNSDYATVQTCHPTLQTTSQKL